MKRKSLERSSTGTQTQIEELPPPAPPVSRWSPPLRVAFRFSFVYFGLFCLASQIAGSLFLIPTNSFRGFGQLWPLRAITFWVATNVFGATVPLVFERNSGETVFFWVQTFWLLIFAIVATALWSVLDRRRETRSRRSRSPTVLAFGHGFS